MKIVGLMLLWLTTVAASAPASQSWPDCRNPVRVFGSHSAISLTPLFQWWARQPVATNAAGYTVADINTNTAAESDRPLSAWHRITGLHVGSVGGSWVVEAVIYTSPTARTNARIFLNHPPAAEEQNYFTLKAQLAEALQEITNCEHAHKADTEAVQKDDARAQAYQRARIKASSTGVAINLRAATRDQAAADAVSGRQKQLEAARDQIETQLKAIPVKNGTYYIDWFAVMVGHTKKDVPIYDLGAVSPNPP